MKKTIFFFLCLTCFSEAYAKAMSGKMALAFCNNNVQCTLLASSYSDGFSYAFLALQADNTVFCIPAGTSSGSLGRIFHNYLLDHPDKLHFTAASLAVTAFSEKFPCNQ